MIELTGVESKRASGMKVDPRSQFVTVEKEGVELKPGDEILLLVNKQQSRREEYGLAFRLTNKTEPEEDEIIIQYGQKLFVAQKIPDFI